MRASSFQGYQFLKLIGGEENGLVTVDLFSDPNQRGETYSEEITNTIFQTELNVQMDGYWNIQRACVVQLAFEHFLWPASKKEVKQKLISDLKHAMASFFHPLFENTIPL
jgi:transcriptional accessory protein Tex/SPT6